MKLVQLQNFEKAYQERVNSSSWPATIARRVMKEHQVRPLPEASQFFFQRKEVILFLSWLVVTLAPMLFGLWYSFSATPNKNTTIETNWHDVKAGYYPAIKKKKTP